MKTVRSYNLWLIAVVAVILLLIIGKANADEELYFIGNKNIPENELRKSDIMNIFLGKQSQWSDKQTITICLLQEKVAYNIFTRRYLNKTPMQFNRYWRKMMFTGKGIMPEPFTSKEELLKFIAETNGAIGYLPSEVNANGVKTISVLH